MSTHILHARALPTHRRRLAVRQDAFDSFVPDQAAMMHLTHHSHWHNFDQFQARMQQAPGFVAASSPQGGNAPISVIGSGVVGGAVTASPEVFPSMTNVNFAQQGVGNTAVLGVHVPHDPNGMVPSMMPPHVHSSPIDVHSSSIPGIAPGGLGFAAADTSTSSATFATTSSGASGPSRTVVIASSVAGAVVAVALIAVLAVFTRRRRQRSAAAGAGTGADSFVWKDYTKQLESAQTQYPASMRLSPITSGNPASPGLNTPTIFAAPRTPAASTPRTPKLNQYPRPDSVAFDVHYNNTIHTPDASYAPNVLGMVKGGAFSPDDSRQRYLGINEAASQAPPLRQLSEYSRDSVVEDDLADELADAFPTQEAGYGGQHQAGMGGRRPSLFDGVSWPRRGRLNTGTEVFGMM